MATVIELLGGECTGKSALAGALAASLDAHVVPEQLRAFVDRHRRTPAQGEQEAIFQAQRTALAQALEASRSDDLVVNDPAALMTAVYSIQYFDDDSLLPVALATVAEADLVVWCQPDFPWAADGLHHDGPDARERTHRILHEQVMPALTEAQVLVADGSVQARVDLVRKALHRS